MRLLARWLVVTLALGTARARADGPGSDNPFLSQARSQIDQLQYDVARQSLDQAMNLGKSGPAELAEIFRLSGEVSAALGQNDDAEQSFRNLLAVDATAELRAGVAPKIAAPFQAAKTFFQSHRPLQISHQVAPGSIAVVIDSDPTSLVVGARATFRLPDGQEQSNEARGAGKITLTLPRGARLLVVVSAIDAHGNRLVEDGSWASPIVVEANATTPAKLPVGPISEGEPPRHGRPLYTRWWLWGGLAAGAATVGVVFGLAARSKQSDLDNLNKNSSQHDFSEADRLASSGRTDALVANLSLGTAAALGVVAAIFIIRGDPHAESSRSARARGTQLVLVPSRSGAGLTLTGSY